MDIKSKIESLLFTAAKPIAVKELARLIDKPVKEVQASCDELMKDYKEAKRGIEIIKNSAKYQMVSAPDNAKLIQKFIKDETAGELTRPSLETLTIIAYRGPVSKLDLERIRGVNCSLILRNLLIRGLIESKTEKKEIYYNITFDFIRFLGVNDVKELPDYERLHVDDSLDRMLNDTSEQN